MIIKSVNPLQNCIIQKHIDVQKDMRIVSGFFAHCIENLVQLHAITGNRKSFLKEGSYCCSCESNTDCLKILTTGEILVQFFVPHKLLIIFSAQFQSFFDLNKSFLNLIDFCADVICN